MRFMTYNIRHGQGEDGWVSNARIASVVREVGPDIIGMNEVWRLGGFFDQPKDLAKRLSLEAAFLHNVGYAFYQQGNLVLTRGTVCSADNLALPGRGEPRGCLLVRIDVDGQEVFFGSVHLALGRKTRARQIAALAEELPRDVPLVLAGDMNCLAGELQPLHELLAFADTPASYPAFWPKRALDHIGYSNHWRLESVGVVKTSASDHRPVVAELTRI